MQIKTRQQGGTILGIIIGLVIGLGIALAVAVTINKTPIPFTDKLAKIGRTADPSGNGQPSDPNRPLYGNKTAAREAAKDFVRDTNSPPPNMVAEPAASPARESKGAVVELASLEKKAEPKASDIKAADIRADVKADIKAAEAAEEKWTYYLQTGAFREQNDAEGMRAKLALIGVEAKVSERQSDNGTLYRVRVGPFAQLDSMNKVRGKLSDGGVDAAVVRVAKQ